MEVTTYTPDDTDACYLQDGTPIDSERFIEAGNAPWAPRTFTTECRMLDRLGRERTYGLTIRADNARQAQKIANIRGWGETVRGEIESEEDIIPA